MRADEMAAAAPKSLASMTREQIEAELIQIADELDRLTWLMERRRHLLVAGRAVSPRLTVRELAEISGVSMTAINQQLAAAKGGGKAARAARKEAGE